jgi:hypothetical protein
MKAPELAAEGASGYRDRQQLVEGVSVGAVGVHICVHPRDDHQAPSINGGEQGDDRWDEPVDDANDRSPREVQGCPVVGEPWAEKKLESG